MKESITILRRARKVLEQMGEDIKLARRRRKLSVQQVADRADISRATGLSKIGQDLMERAFTDQI